MNDLTITTVQAALHWEDKSKNLKMFDAMLENIENTDLIILPEMFNTGFTMRASDFAEHMNGDTVSWMFEKSKEHNAAICGSLIINDDGKYFNRLLFVEPNGNINQYDKRHLFSMGDEDKYYNAGTRSLIIDYKSWQINLVICYDLRFPEGIRNTRENPYDLAIIVANWPDKRIEHWDILLRARAIENQCYVIGVNRTGLDGNDIMHSGHTQVVHPFGNLLYISDVSEVNNLVLSRNELKFNRRAFPFIKDRI
jgi:predicted amidohydrolase